MDIEKQMYAKTERLGEHTWEWLLTEKLDGANLCMYKQGGMLLVASRNNVLPLDEAVEGIQYKDLGPWLKEHGGQIRDALPEGSAICGEWLGMGAIRYPDTFPQFNMFAKARLVGSLLEPLRLDFFDYDPENFRHMFPMEAVPGFIGVVPVVARTSEAPTVEMLDRFYAEYSERVGRPVEGIVITQKPVPDRRCKYVRMKNGKLEPFATKEQMEERMRAGMERAAKHTRRKGAKPNGKHAANG